MKVPSAFRGTLDRHRQRPLLSVWRETATLNHLLPHVLSPEER